MQGIIRTHLQISNRFSKAQLLETMKKLLQKIFIIHLSWIPTQDKSKETGGSGSGSSRQNGKRPADNENSEQQLMARENHHRHTPHQIHEMESFFQRCSHPDKKQRTKIGQDLGLDPEKVKYWFQNRRTQMKVYQDRNDNVTLKMENDNLKNVILQLEETLKNHTCPSCSSVQQHAHQLRHENSWLKQEAEKVGNVFASNPANATDDKEERKYADEEDFDTEDIYDSDEYDLGESQMSHETLMESLVLKGFFKTLDEMKAEEINEPDRKWHCPACYGGPGAIDWHRGL